ncbi:MAG: hypothetical protein Q9227_002374 [Pyrenula ochraceoflavens]
MSQRRWWPREGTSDSGLHHSSNFFDAYAYMLVTANPTIGFVGDAVGPYIKATFLNPTLTLPLFLLAHYTGTGKTIRAQHPTALNRLRLLLYLGLFRIVNAYLSRRALNNSVSDSYHWLNELVVVTGGSDGIGKQITLLFAKRQISIAVLDVQTPTYDLPRNVTYHKCDITSRSAISHAASAIRESHGKSPTVLINNAGVARGRTILDAKESDVRLTFDVNAISHYWLVQEFLPEMIKKNHGMVVTIASLAAYLASASLVDYASSKAAALAFHEGLTSELVTRYNAPKVRTVLVTQGYTKTPLFQGFNQGKDFMNPALEVETVAEGVVGAVLKGESGQVLLPGSLSFLVPALRILPYWYSLKVRNGAARLMEGGWNGRQVIDPEKKYGATNEAEKVGQ